MERYEKYKDSGVDGIGSIPDNWGITKLKFHTNKIIDGAHFTPTYIDDTNGIPFLRVTDIHSVNIDLNNVKRIPLNEHNELVKRCDPKKGDLLLSKNGTIGIMKIINWDWEFSIFVSLCLIRFEESLLNSFFYYFFQSSVVERQIFESSQKTSVTNLHLEKIKELRLTLPSLLEQTAITNYLDKKTSELDTLIAKKEKLIELLKEERTAIINQAVTKGLDPDVEMKDSQVEWLGEIPAHWGVKPLRYVGETQNGISAGAEYFGSGYPFVSYGDVYKNAILPKSVVGLANSTEKERANFSVKRGDVLFTRTSETVEEIGIASICMEDVENAVYAGFLIRFRPNDNLLFEGFSKYYFRNDIHRIFFIKEMNIVTRASLSQGLLKRLLILLPSIKEQIEISEYLDYKTMEVDNLISKTEQEITLLKEYKTALISEVVTGKVKVI